MAYTINLKNGQRLDMEVYLAFDQPELMDPGPEPDLDASKVLSEACNCKTTQGFRWPAVRRSRMCQGLPCEFLESVTSFLTLQTINDGSPSA